MTVARLLVVIVGVTLPYVMRIPGMAVYGVRWFTSYFDKATLSDILFVGLFDAACWGSILLATFTYRHPRSVWILALFGFALPALGHATLDLLHGDGQAGMARVVFPILSLPLVFVGWLVGLVFDRRVFKDA